MISAVIVAGGRGERLASDLPKQFLAVLGKPILLRAVEVIWRCTRVSEMIVVAPETHIEVAKKVLSGKEVKVVSGGAERQDSVYAGLVSMSEKAELVLIHDGVRPFVSLELIERVIAAAEKSGAAVPGVALKDTVKEVDEKTGFAISTVDRRRLSLIQTPQVFRRGIIQEAHEKAQSLGFYATDDAGLVEWLGMNVAVVAGEDTNLKITTRLDLELAEIVAKSRD